MLATLLFIISLLSDLPTLEAVDNYNKFFSTVAMIESNGDNTATNKHSSAKGYFQVVDGTFIVMKKRAKRMNWNVKAKVVTELSYAEQKALIFIDLYQRKDTDIIISAILSGDKDMSRMAYFKYHHTKPDNNTIVRAHKMFDLYYN